MRKGMMMLRRRIQMILMLTLLSLLASCGTAGGGAAGNATPGATGGGNATPGAAVSGNATTIILGAYTTPREAYGKLIPIFKERWKQQTGEDLTFQESYLGSGAQSRAIVEGFEADIAALSLEADVTNIVKAGLITHDWSNTPTKGMVSDSVVA